MWDTHTNKHTIAPYREKLRSSDSVFLRAYFFDIYDQGPAGPDPAGGPARPVQKAKEGLIALVSLDSLATTAVIGGIWHLLETVVS